MTAAPAVVRNEGQALDIDGLRRTPLVPEPFPHLIIPGFVRGPARAALAAGFPGHRQGRQLPGRRPAIRAGLRRFRRRTRRAGAARRLRREIRHRSRRPADHDHGARPGPREPMAASTPTAARKLITVLIYMNEAWEARGRPAAPAALARRARRRRRRGAAGGRHAAGLPQYAAFLARPCAGRAGRAG